jgi:glycerophosphoryl diester phosphodiesterase
MRAPDWLTAHPIAHRGLHDLTLGIVENTPSAVTAAVDKNFAIEVDLQLSSDGEAMVYHDDELGRLTNGIGSLIDKTAADLKQIAFRETPDRMMTLTELCELVAGRVPMVLEVKSRFMGDRRLITRMRQVLSSYSGPVVAMSFDPDQLIGLRELIPSLPRGIVAQRTYDDAYWAHLTDTQRHGMLGLRHGFQTQPHFVAYWIDQLPSPAPWMARNIFGCPLLSWTVRTPAQRTRVAKFADQMIFEGFLPNT